MIEQRDNGDLVVFATNGDPLVKLQADGGFLMVNINRRQGEEWEDHPLNCRAEQLGPEAIDAVRQWCEEQAQSSFDPETTGREAA